MKKEDPKITDTKKLIADLENTDLENTDLENPDLKDYNQMLEIKDQVIEELRKKLNATIEYIRIDKPDNKAQYNTVGDKDAKIYYKINGKEFGVNLGYVKKPNFIANNLLHSFIEDYKKQNNKRDLNNKGDLNALYSLIDDKIFTTNEHIKNFPNNTRHIKNFRNNSSSNEELACNYLLLKDCKSMVDISNKLGASTTFNFHERNDGFCILVVTTPDNKDIKIKTNLNKLFVGNYNNTNTEEMSAKDIKRHKFLTNKNLRNMTIEKAPNNTQTPPQKL